MTNDARKIPPAPALSEALKSTGHTDIGSKRGENQDAYCCIERENFCFYAVADGMGGVRGGSLASQLAIETVASRVGKCTVLEPEDLSVAVRDANTHVFSYGQKNPAVQGLGTTLVGLAFAAERLFLVNVGDSRAYRFRHGSLQQLSRDHTIAEELIRSGTITVEQAKTNPIGHLLSRSIGPAPEVSADCYVCEQRPRAGDVYLLCTDGLYGQVRNSDIEQVLRESLTLKVPLNLILEQLVQLSLKNGGLDNCTGILISVDDSYAAISKQIQRSISKNRKRSVRFNNREFVQPLNHAPLAASQHSSRLLNRIWREYQSILRSSVVGMFFLGFGFGIGVYYDRVFSSRKGISVSALGMSESSSRLPQNLETERARMGLKRSPGDLDSQVSFLDTEVNELQSELDQLGRKISIWKLRQKRMGTGEFDAVVAEAAVFSEAVQKQKNTFDQINFEYLKEAERLVYNPLDQKQETVVGKIAILRQESREKLKAVTAQAISQSILESSEHLTELSKQRDEARLQRAELDRR